MMDWSMIGAGAGLIPTLWKLLNGQDNNNSTMGSTNPMAGTNPDGSTAWGTLGADGIRNPSSAVLNQLPGLAQGIPYQSVTNENPDQLMAAANAASPSSSGSGMGDLSKALSGLGKSLGGSGPTSTPGGAPYQPPPPPTPQGGGGPNPGMMGATAGGFGMNPMLMAFLKARLANAGGGLG